MATMDQTAIIRPSLLKHDLLDIISFEEPSTLVQNILDYHQQKFFVAFHHRRSLLHQSRL